MINIKNLYLRSWTQLFCGQEIGGWTSDVKGHRAKVRVHRTVRRGRGCRQFNASLFHAAIRKSIAVRTGRRHVAGRRLPAEPQINRNADVDRQVTETMHHQQVAQGLASRRVCRTHHVVAVSSARVRKRPRQNAKARYPNRDADDLRSQVSRFVA